jgi:hypothetical protein
MFFWGGGATPPSSFAPGEKGALINTIIKLDVNNYNMQYH